jgi:hypothetical protein
MVTKEGVLQAGLEALKGKSMSEMMGLPVEVRREVAWYHPLLLSSWWCWKRDADIVMAV